MSADLLREAADVLRERTEAATPTPWIVTGPESSEWTDLVVSPSPKHANVVDTVADCDTSDENAAYIATMHPGVGLALADWLDLAADGACCDECMTDPAADPLRAAALDTARKILGRAS